MFITVKSDLFKDSGVLSFCLLAVHRLLEYWYNVTENDILL